MMENDLTGILAISHAGSDKGRIYFILKEEAPYLWLADGRRRTTANPKKKKRKHVQLIKPLSEAAGTFEPRRERELSDADIRRIIKLYIAAKQEAKMIQEEN